MFLGNTYYHAAEAAVRYSESMFIYRRISFRRMRAFGSSSKHRYKNGGSSGLWGGAFHTSTTTATLLLASSSWKSTCTTGPSGTSVIPSLVNKSEVRLITILAFSGIWACCFGNVNFTQGVECTLVSKYHLCVLPQYRANLKHAK